MPSRNFHPRFDRVIALVAFLIAVLWVPTASHELLELAGWIHQDSDHDGHGMTHEAADGLCQLHHGGAVVKAPTMHSVGFILVIFQLSISGLLFVSSTASYLRRATEPPPGLARTWQFLLRLALPSRAPSFAI